LDIKLCKTVAEPFSLKGLLHNRSEFKEILLATATAMSSVTLSVMPLSSKRRTFVTGPAKIGHVG